jgi:uncharacterized membrane protein YoaK (UPF0700 family)
MVRYDRRTQALAVCLSALAGFVDAIGFINLGGFFVSFMSGNSTRLGVGLAEGSANARVAFGLIATFVAGVVLGSLLGRRAGTRRRVIVLAAVAVLLTIAAGLGAVGLGRPAVVFMALAMGAENTVFEEDGEVRIGLTYMTGTLVKVGQRIAGAMTGGAPFAWAPFLILWIGLACGALAGAAIYARVGLAALWIAAVLAAALVLVAHRLETATAEDR